MFEGKIGVLFRTQAEIDDAVSRAQSALTNEHLAALAIASGALDRDIEGKTFSVDMRAGLKSEATIGAIE